MSKNYPQVKKPESFAKRQQSDVYKLLNNVEDLMAKSTNLFFGHLIKLDALDILIKKIRTNLPSELEEARRVLDRQESILLDAEHKAADMVAAAEQRAADVVRYAEEHAERMVEESAITLKAQQRAEIIVSDAEAHVRETVRNVNNYTLNVFESLEENFAQFSDHVTNTKDAIVSNLREFEGSYVGTREQSAIPEGTYEPEKVYGDFESKEYDDKYGDFDTEEFDDEDDGFEDEEYERK